MTNYKPILAATLPFLEDAKLPALASPKLDGVRCALIESPRTNKRLAATRTLKPIPNEYIRRTLEQSNLPVNLDGELTVGLNFQQTVSGVMSYEGMPDFTYHVFDYFDDSKMPFVERYERLQQIVTQANCSWLKLVEHVTIQNHDQLATYEQVCLAAGYEGVMLRKPTGRYKFGRSTQNEGILLKLKRFLDSEAKVVGFVEMQHNDNVGTRNALGQLERSSFSGNLVPAGMLGALKVKDIHTGITFEIGTGFTQAQRLKLWHEKDFYVNKILTYKYQAHGMKDKPRAPVFLRWRPDIC